MMEQLFGLSQLHNNSLVYDRYPVGYEPHHGQVMRNEQVRQAMLVLQVVQQVQHLRANRNVQRRYGFIRNYEFRRENAVPEVSPPSPDSMSLIAEKCFLFEYASITLQELAGRLGISPRQTERFLKKEYGESFQQKKTHARMAAAASFLADPSLSITAISDRLGYSSAEHFSHAFRNYYGVSPRQYRKDAALF